jgi:hypothetical protein
MDKGSLNQGNCAGLACAVVAQAIDCIGTLEALGLVPV